MSLTPIDQIIAREVGQLCWYMLPDIHFGLTLNEDQPEFEAIWSLDEPDELKNIRNEDPLVNYPVIYLGSEVAFGLAPRPYLHPSIGDAPLPLSEYMSILRRFIILQLTTKENAHVPLIIRAVKHVVDESSTKEALNFVDQLWRGRWILGAFDWSHMRRLVITGGTEEAIRALEDDISRLEEEAIRLITTVRQIKESVKTMDEWLHEIYCLVPDIMTWLFTIGWGNERHKSDELEKYDRVLDEFIADIKTTIHIPCNALNGASNLATEYTIKPLVETRNTEEAIKKIRGIYKGRTIIPRIWYENAKDCLERLEKDGELKRVERNRDFLLEDPVRYLPENELDILNKVDVAQVFGRAYTMDRKDDRWLLLLSMVDYYEDE